MLCDECRLREIDTNGAFCSVCAKKTKECKKCLEVKGIFSFEKNQRTPKGMVSRRSECKTCRKGKTRPITQEARRKYETQNPRPAINDPFECPVCEKIFTVTSNQSVNLDHDQETGEIRGWLCGSCNTSIGRLGDNVSILARAILWIKDKGKMPVLFFFGE